MGFLSKKFLRLKDLDELRAIHAEKTLKMEEVESFRTEWEEEEEIIREREANIEWVERLNNEIQFEKIGHQINQINIGKLIEIIKENKEILFTEGE